MKTDRGRFWLFGKLPSLREDRARYQTRLARTAGRLYFGAPEGRYHVNAGVPLMVLDPDLERNREVIRRIAEAHGARNVRVFGSRARGEAGPDSDVDLLVEAGPETSSWFPAGLIVDLEDTLGYRVEVVTESGLHPSLRERVLREAVPL